MNALTGTQGLKARTYDVGVRGRVSFLYVDQSMSLVGMRPEVLEELSTLGVFNLNQTRLNVSDSLINNRLQRLLNDVLSVCESEIDQVGGYLKVPLDAREAVLISVFPYCHSFKNSVDFSFTHFLAEIRISYPKQTNLPMFSRAMRDLYELSASESKVVSLLVQGRNTKEIASTLEVADSTLRTHLKRIFSKTETRHQAELVSKILQYDSYVMPDSFAS